MGLQFEELPKTLQKKLIGVSVNKEEPKIALQLDDGTILFLNVEENEMIIRHSEEN